MVRIALGGDGRLLCRLSTGSWGCPSLSQNQTERDPDPFHLKLGWPFQVGTCKAAFAQQPTPACIGTGMHANVTSAYR